MGHMYNQRDESWYTYADFLYFHYNPRLQCSNNMCASVFQHIFTALALQLHCSSDKDNKYMLDIFSLQFVRLQLEMKSNIQSFSPFAYNLSSQTFTYQYIHPSWFFERTFTHHRPQLNKRHLPIGTFTHHRPQLKKDIPLLGLLPVTGLSWKKKTFTYNFWRTFLSRTMKQKVENICWEYKTWDGTL